MNFFIVFFTEDGQSHLSCIGRLRFEQFNMVKVLANSTHLMASEGKEFDLEEDPTLGKRNYSFLEASLNSLWKRYPYTFTGLDTKEKMAKQRQLLNARLGLDVATKIGFDTNALFTNEDLITSQEKTPFPGTKVINFLRHKP